MFFFFWLEPDLRLIIYGRGNILAFRGYINEVK